MCDKIRVREALKSIRGNIADRSKKDKLLSERLLQWIQKEFPSSKTLFCYQSFGTEADTHRLINRAKMIYSVCVPAVNPDFSMYPTGLNGERTAFYPDITIVPLLGFNEELHRIGYGKGCYDRWFIENTRTIKVGLAYDEQLCAFVPEPQDVPLDYVITPTKFYTRNPSDKRS